MVNVYFAALAKIRIKLFRNKSSTFVGHRHVNYLFNKLYYYSIIFNKSIWHKKATAHQQHSLRFVKWIVKLCQVSISIRMLDNWTCFYLVLLKKYVRCVFEYISLHGKNHNRSHIVSWYVTCMSSNMAPVTVKCLTYLRYLLLCFSALCRKRYCWRHL